MSMIGIYAILWESAFVALFSSLTAFSAWELIKARRRKPTDVFTKKNLDATYMPLVGTIFMLVLMALLANRILREIRFHSDLSHLRPEIVEGIEIGDQTVTDKRQIAEIVEVLTHTEWYVMRRRDAAAAVPFVIQLASRKQYRYEVTPYRRGGGAALVSRSPSGWDNGEAFSVGLPAR
jgi:hypothetical protein